MDLKMILYPTDGHRQEVNSPSAAERIQLKYQLSERVVDVVHIDPADIKGLGITDIFKQEHHRVLSVGAGYGVLPFAGRLIQTGFWTAADITMVDEAGGFGGFGLPVTLQADFVILATGLLNTPKILVNEFPLPDQDLADDGLHPEYLLQMRGLDFPRHEAICQRIASIVQNPITAEALKPWYPEWCKRPCLNDSFLQAFNPAIYDTTQYQPARNPRYREQNHHRWGEILRGRRPYPVHRIPFWHRARQQALRDRPPWSALAGETEGGGISTTLRDFPTLFFPSPFQVGATGNHVYTLDELATHIAYIIAESFRVAATTGTADA
ncbi:uncharacterized protein N7482_005055 [Penicillium canariense]|uniref:Uncharacterized protein n=1 Tax=Penicillium canariense TaxID=189055 RepID=A0A9W9I1N8_9EURO|nr:uncharacterized protein N7482_005055 [Penicillium canariense]KAJ5166274.1 hypothetical protein N7482_005055 [Penicillium canariense]